MAVFEVRDCCPECGSKNFKKNGHIHNGKQNHKCKDCERQFVMVVEKKTITEEDKELIDKLLLERISLQGICRVTNISMTWLLIYIENLYDSLPDHLNFHIIEEISPNLIIQQLEVDEMWSFVEKKANKQWIWIAMDPVSKQV
ncbi:MAG: IS1 family transposase, partial [Gammaproteobacteria bacterium]|nr:IS1 family transposase [Gammaproteobacteria bacterium]